MELEFVKTRADVEQNVRAFNNDADRERATVQSLIRQTCFWVYDERTGRFAPSKFAGFRGMTLKDYRRAKEDRRANEGASFNGHLTRLAISRALGDRPYSENSRLSLDLVHWADGLGIRKPLDGIDRKKWRFVSL